MKSFQKILNFFVFSLGISTVCSLSAGEETAWARKSQQDVQQSMADENMCRFESQLSTFGYKEYMKLSPEQKKKAMDYADGNKMNPDAAVMRAMAD